MLLRLYMFNVLSVREEALDFSTMIYRCCEAMEEMMREFRNFRKSGLISEKIVEINRLEEEADALYTKAVRRLYLSSKDPVRADGMERDIRPNGKVLRHLRAYCKSCGKHYNEKYLIFSCAATARPAAAQYCSGSFDFFRVGVSKKTGWRMISVCLKPLPAFINL